MNQKIQKIVTEIEKVKSKIATQQARLRELEQQKTELENTEIVGMVLRPGGHAGGTGHHHSGYSQRQYRRPVCGRTKSGGTGGNG